MNYYTISWSPCPNNYECETSYFNCHLPKNRELCKKLIYLQSKNLAISEKYEIFKDNRGNSYKPSKSLEKDLTIEIFICENIYKKAKIILEEYKKTGIATREIDIQFIYRIKKKIQSNVKTKEFIKSNIDKVLSEYIDYIGLKTFTNEELDIYVNAFTYLYKKKNFKLSRKDKPRVYDAFLFDWFEFAEFLSKGTHNPGKSISFLSAFCSDYKVNRNTCTRLFSYFNNLKYFSYADLDYIANSLLETLELEEFNTDTIQYYLDVIYAFTTNKKSES